MAAANIFRRWVTVPVFESAEILSKAGADRVEIVLASRTRDLDREVKPVVNTFKSFRRGEGGKLSDEVEFGQDKSDEVLMSLAHEHVEGQKVIFRSCKDAKQPEKKRNFVERWSRSALLQTVEVTSCHGDFNADSAFGRVSFHPTIHSRIAYVAEKKKPDDETYKRFEYVDDWGSDLVGKSTPTVVVLDFEGGLPEQVTEDEQNSTADSDKKKDTNKPVTKGKVVVMDPPESSACGDVTFTPSGDQVTFVATNILPRRYGIIWCPNRRATMMQANYDGSDFQDLTESLEHVRSPQYSKDGRLYFLSNPSGRAHAPTSAIHAYNPTSKELKVVYDHVHENDPTKIGIHAVVLNCIDGRWLALNTSHQSTIKPILFEIKPGGSLDEPMEAVTDSNTKHSWSMIGCGKGQIITSHHAPNGDLELRHRDLTTNVETSFYTSKSPKPDILEYNIRQYPSRDNLQSILYLPKKQDNPLIPQTSSKPPAIVIPHGGPHSMNSTTFSSPTAAYLDSGVAMLWVNYTGSCGQGQTSIDALLGHVGDLDVSDVQFARDELASSGLVDPERIAILGGSHGGFLTAWMLGKFPKSYKCGVLLNPVINLGTVGAQSDIPDWAHSEMGMDFDLAKPPRITPDRYERMWNASPMSVADKVEAPVLMLLGGKDIRVPNYEGRNWVTYLRGNGHENVQSYMFPEDGHSLDSAEAFKPIFECITTFLKENL